MRKILIITGMITLLGMINLTLTSNFSWGSGTQDSTVQIPVSVLKEEYLQLFKLLEKKTELSKKQLDETLKIYDSITGNRVTKKILPKDDILYFLQNPQSIYPKPQPIYNVLTYGMHSSSMPLFYKHYIYSILVNEKYHIPTPLKQMNTEINTRLKYRGAIAKAISLQALQHAEKRFERITNLLNTTNKTQDLKEAAKLQAELKYMLAMIQNESIKIQMVKNLINSEKAIIDTQRVRIYLPALKSNQTMPAIRFQ
ncbi:type IV secretion system protein [Bartonella grahamii]|uniref:type IV secretion system protein n=1 Tax=Bartonella grahamii TaxID=33045 RepID=UPI002E7B258D|nr:type IV secretion system protein [Bartonella grahamii]